MNWQSKLAKSKGKSGSDEKMSNTPSTCNLGHSHRSKLESSVCALLQQRQLAGEIEIVQVEDHIYLTDARIGYIPDFKCRYVKSGDFFWVEAKGYANDRWPIKKKLWKFYGPGPLEIWKGSYARPWLDETITPQARPGATP